FLCDWMRRALFPVFAKPGVLIEDRFFVATRPTIAGTRTAGVFPFQFSRQTLAAPGRKTPSVVPGDIYNRTIVFSATSAFLCHRKFPHPAMRTMTRIERLVHQIGHGPLMHLEGRHLSSLTRLVSQGVRAIKALTSGNVPESCSNLSIN